MNWEVVWRKGVAYFKLESQDVHVGLTKICYVSRIEPGTS